jgi:hypothetical protein
MTNQSTSTIIWPHPYSSAPTIHPEIVKVKRTTRTIEKYNEVGKLIEREIITEEEEIIDKQIWKTDPIKSPYDPPYEVYCGDTNGTKLTTTPLYALIKWKKN